MSSGANPLRLPCVPHAVDGEIHGTKCGDVLWEPLLGNRPVGEDWLPLKILGIPAGRWLLKIREPLLGNSLVGVDQLPLNVDVVAAVVEYEPL